jgi:hypothetical protein
MTMKRKRRRTGVAGLEKPLQPLLGRPPVQLAS